MAVTTIDLPCNISLLAANGKIAYIHVLDINPLAPLYDSLAYPAVPVTEITSDVSGKATIPTNEKLKIDGRFVYTYHLDSVGGEPTGTTGLFLQIGIDGQPLVSTCPPPPAAPPPPASPPPFTGIQFQNLTCGAEIMAQYDSDAGIMRSLYVNIEDNAVPSNPLYASTVWKLIPGAGSYASHNGRWLYHHHTETSIEDSHTTSNWKKVMRNSFEEDPCTAIQPPPPPPSEPPPSQPPSSPPRKPPASPPGPNSPPPMPSNPPPVPASPPPNPPNIIYHKNPGAQHSLELMFLAHYVC